MRRLYKHKLFLISLVLGVMVSLMVLGADFDSAVSQLATASFPILMLAPAVLIVEILVRGLRLRVMASIWKRHIGYLDTVRINLAGDFANAVTPGSIGGGPVRGYHLTRVGFSTEEATAIVLGERMTDHVALVVLGAALLVFAYDSAGGVGHYLAFMGGVSALALICCFLYFRGQSRFSQGRFGRFLSSKIYGGLSPDSRLRPLLNSIAAFWNRLRHDLRQMVTSGGRRFVLCGALSTASQFLRAAIPLILVYGLHLDVPVAACVLWVLIKRYGLDSMPVPGANGISETAFLWYFGRFAALGSLGSFLLLWRFFSYYFYVLVGGMVTVFTIGKGTRSSWDLSNYLNTVSNETHGSVDEPAALRPCD